MGYWSDKITLNRNAWLSKNPMPSPNMTSHGFKNIADYTRWEKSTQKWGEINKKLWLELDFETIPFSLYYPGLDVPNNPSAGGLNRTRIKSGFAWELAALTEAAIGVDSPSPPNAAEVLKIVVGVLVLLGATAGNTILWYPFNRKMSPFKFMINFASQLLVQLKNIASDTGWFRLNAKMVYELYLSGRIEDATLQQSGIALLFLTAFNKYSGFGYSGGIVMSMLWYAIVRDYYQNEVNAQFDFSGSGDISSIKDQAKYVIDQAKLFAGLLILPGKSKPANFIFKHYVLTATPGSTLKGWDIPEDYNPVADQQNSLVAEKSPFKNVGECFDYWFKTQIVDGYRKLYVQDGKQAVFYKGLAIDENFIYGDERSTYDNLFTDQGPQWSANVHEVRKKAFEENWYNNNPDIHGYEIPIQIGYRGTDALSYALQNSTYLKDPITLIKNPKDSSNFNSSTQRLGDIDRRPWLTMVMEDFLKGPEDVERTNTKGRRVYWRDNQSPMSNESCVMKQLQNRLAKCQSLKDYTQFNQVFSIFPEGKDEPIYGETCFNYPLPDNAYVMLPDFFFYGNEQNYVWDAGLLGVLASTTFCIDGVNVSAKGSDLFKWVYPKTSKPRRFMEWVYPKTSESSESNEPVFCMLMEVTVTAIKPRFLDAFQDPFFTGKSALDGFKRIKTTPPNAVGIKDQYDWMGAAYILDIGGEDEYVIAKGDVWVPMPNKSDIPIQRVKGTFDKVSIESPGNMQLNPIYYVWDKKLHSTKEDFIFFDMFQGTKNGESYQLPNTHLQWANTFVGNKYNLFSTDDLEVYDPNDTGDWLTAKYRSQVKGVTVETQKFPVVNNDALGWVWPGESADDYNNHIYNIVDGFTPRVPKCNNIPSNINCSTKASPTKNACSLYELKRAIICNTPTAMGTTFRSFNYVINNNGDMRTGYQDKQFKYQLMPECYWHDLIGYDRQFPFSTITQTQYSGISGRQVSCFDDNGNLVTLDCLQNELYATSYFSSQRYIARGFRYNAPFEFYTATTPDYSTHLHGYELLNEKFLYGCYGEFVTPEKKAVTPSVIIEDGNYVETRTIVHEYLQVYKRCSSGQVYYSELPSGKNVDRTYKYPPYGTINRFGSRTTRGGTWTTISTMNLDYPKPVTLTDAYPTNSVSEQLSAGGSGVCESQLYGYPW